MKWVSSHATIGTFARAVTDKLGTKQVPTVTDTGDVTHILANFPCPPPPLSVIPYN